MYILQLSDFHISENTDRSLMSKKINLLCAKLKTILPTGSQLLCCMLGDFPDKGVSGSYALAEALVTEMKSALASVVE